MRLCIGLLTALVASVMLLGGVQGEQAKQVTITGTVTCAKCDLKAQKDACATVVVEKVAGKADVVYYFDEAGHKKHHGPICTSPTPGTVTGTVEDKDGKKIITVTDVKLKK